MQYLTHLRAVKLRQNSRKRLRYNQLFAVFALMYAPGHKNIFRRNNKVEKSEMPKIFPAQTDEDFDITKTLFVEYVFMELKLV